MKLVRMTTLGLAVMMGASAVRAVTLYEWRDANGQTVYSQVAPTGEATHVTVKQIDTQQLTPAQRLAARMELAAEDAATQQQAKQLRREVKQSDTLIVRRLRELGQAERALKQGRTPLPGERRHNFGGGSRLLASYFERQRQLEANVNEARKKLDEAYAQRNQLTP